MNGMLSHPSSWRTAWTQAACGPEGFWRTEHPRSHFATAVAASPVVAERIAGLLRAWPRITTVLDVGAGDGHLLHQLAALRPDLRLIGVDAAGRPPGLSAAVGWYTDVWDVDTADWTTGSAGSAFETVDGPALTVMTEWLDDLPCRVALRQGAVHELLVHPCGAEQIGSPVPEPEQAWAQTWWPDGERMEIGTTRDQAWARMLQAMPYGGLGLMIDYGHVAGQRPRNGSLAAYAHGRPAPLIPSANLNITAAVAVDAVEAAGRRAGAETMWLARQAQVLRRRDWANPSQPDGSRSLDRLVRDSQLRALTAPSRWGSHWWLLQRRPSAAMVD